MKRWAWVAVLLVAAPVYSQSEPVRLRLFWTRPPAKITIRPAAAGVRIRRCPSCDWNTAASLLQVSASGDGLAIGGKVVGAGPLQIEGEQQMQAEGTPSFALHGPVQITAKDGRLLVVASFSLEDYTARVLLGESGNFTSEEALKAMAVAVRTFAVRNRWRHAAEGFDLCDTTHCQDLRLAPTPARLADAARETAGEILWYEGRPAAIYYHRDCGGRTEAAHEVWPGERFPYLQSQADLYCTYGQPRTWRAEIKKADLAAALESEGVRVPRPLQAVAVRNRTSSGRVSELWLAGSGAVPVRAATLRLAVGRQLGWTLIRSDQYEVRDNGASMTFVGRGAGHGVGLCQAGAARMGESGKTYEEILAFYFPGTRVGTSAQGIAWRALGSAQVEILTTEPRQDASLVELAERALREAEARTGMQSRVRPQVRVYPSIDVYRDATGQPGWMAASTRGRVIRLQPLEQLRRKGTLEETLRHEMMHVVVESRARPGLPLWFREGLVLVLLDESVDAAESAMAIEEIERALSEPSDRARMQRAQAAARARVANLLKENGKAKVLSWLSSGLPAGVGR